MWGDYEMIFPITDLYQRNHFEGMNLPRRFINLMEVAPSGSEAKSIKAEFACVHTKSL